MRDWLTWARFIAERERVPFAHDASGQDCARFAGGAVLALTGRDPLAGLRWNGATSARAQIRRLGGKGGLRAAVSTRLREVAPALAHRGDVAGIEDAEHGLMLMVVEGATLVGPGASGLRRAPRSAMVRAWSSEA